MSKKEKDVELIPDPPSGWKVKHGTKIGSGPSTYPKVEFAKDSGPHLVVFKLPADSTATFDDIDPIWITKGTSSPTVRDIDEQITDWAIFDGGKTLVLLDSNSKDVTLSYRVKADGYGAALDPIIKNGGVTIPPPTPSYSAVEIAVASLALLASFFIGFYLRR